MLVDHLDHIDFRQSRIATSDPVMNRNYMTGSYIPGVKTYNNPIYLVDDFGNLIEETDDLLVLSGAFIRSAAPNNSAYAH